MSRLDQRQVAGFAQDLPIQRVAAMFIRLRGKKHPTHLTAVAVFMERASKTLHGVAVSSVLPRDYQFPTDAALRSVLPVIVLQTVHLSHLPLGESLLSDWLPTGGADEAGRVIGSLQCTDHMIHNDLTTGPAGLQTGLVAVFTQRDPGFVVVHFPCERHVTLPALKTAAVVRPVQGLDGRL